MLFLYRERILQKARKNNIKPYKMKNNSLECNMNYSLLFSETETRPRLDLQVFRDLGINRILSSDVLRLLSLPCCKNDVIARQQIFRELQNEAFLDSIIQLKSQILEFKTAQTVLLECNNNFEYAHCFVEYAESYIKSLDLIMSVQSSSFLFVKLKSDIEKAHRLSQIKELYVKLAAMRKEISYIHLSLSSGQAAFSDCVPEESSGVANVKEAFQKCIVDLGYQPKSGMQISRKLPSAMVGSTEKLFAGKLAPMLELCAYIEDLIFDADSVIDLSAQIDFYLKINTIRHNAEQNGLPCCFPEVSDTRRFAAKSAYNIVLLYSGIAEIVKNDMEFSKEKGNNIVFIIGANGGGKTTYLRTVGINLLLFSRGCPIFAENAVMSIPSSIFTHFPSGETNQSGRFEEEKQRVSDILQNADDNCWVFLNETFSGTNAKKAVTEISTTANILNEKNAFCLYVTHFFEAEDLGFPVLMPLVDADREHNRSYIIAEKSRQQNNSSFADDILRKYRLDGFSLMNITSKSNKKETD